MQPPHSDAALGKLAAIFWVVHEPAVRAGLRDSYDAADSDTVIAEMKKGYLRELQETYRKKRLVSSFAHMVLRRV